MGQIMHLTAEDGHQLDAYHAVPQSAPLGALVVVQEIFGVTDHIRRVTDRWAEFGFEAMAPAFFDRIKRGVALDYSNAQEGIGYVKQLQMGKVKQDLQAAVEALQGVGKVGVVGYCWGGSIAHFAAQHLPVDAAVAYYGGQIGSMLDDPLRCPVMYHFGEQDQMIGPEVVEAVRRAYPDQRVYLYPAGHGFNCDERDSYEPESAKLALERSADFFKANLKA